MVEIDFDSRAAVALVDRLAGTAVAILGDLMLDRYWWGSVTRLSPEAPVPVVHKRRTTVAPGGAANTAANVTSLGGRPHVVGVVGEDYAGGELRAALAARGIATDDVLTAAGRPTTVKTRIVAVGQHIVRVDEEDTSPVGAHVADAIFDRVAMLLRQASSLVVSDYAKGLLGPDLLVRVLDEAAGRGVRVIVDPKGREFSRYRGAFLICPNRTEALEAAGLDAEEPDAVRRAGTRLLESVKVEAVLITLGEAGMMLFERGEEPLLIGASARTVYDVTGAGDPVAATLGLAVGAGAPLKAAVRLANVAAGVAVEHFGTAAATAAELRAALLESFPAGL